MTRNRAIFLLVSIVVLLAVLPASAATYYVGSCKTGSYSTISAAVSDPTIAAGSTIQICPGTYTEQVVISKPLTLQGIASKGAHQVTVQGSPSDTALTSLSGLVIRPSIWITAGPVNLSDINVAQTLASSDCVTLITGIYYGTDGYGTANHVNISISTQSRTNCPGSLGMLAENGDVSTLDTVTVQNSTFAVEYGGIYGYSGQPSGFAPVLSTTINNNQLYLSSAGTGITLLNGQGAVTGNVIASASTGVSFNEQGLLKVTGNKIDAATGIAIGSPGSTVTGNTIRALTGISMGCNKGTVSGNTITGGYNGGSSTGVLNAPLGFSGVNTFYNIAILSPTIC
jgi:hypothetical protein